MGTYSASGDEDHELVSRAQHGEREAFDRLMLRHQADVAALMTRFSRDPGTVEELTQTVFVNAYLSLGNYLPQAPFVHWLRVVANRVGYAHWRREYRKTSRESFDENMHAGKKTPENAPHGGREERSEALAKVMAKLNPAERQVLYLLYYDDLSVAKAAEIMGWNSAMTKMRAYRARMKLRKLLKMEQE